MEPYRRTGQLGGSITTEVRPLGGKSYVGVIGTNKVYAPFVISTEAVGGRGPQAQYHKGVWYTLQEVVEKCRDAINKIYHSTIMNKINSH